MAKNSITDYDNTSGNNTDVQSVDISEGCSPSGINNAIREVMADLADVNDGTVALTSPQVDSLTLNGNASFGDNDKAIFGAGNDLQIYHDGSVSVISEAGTGDFNLQTNGANIALLGNSGSEYMANFASNGAATLYYDNSAKIATTSTGVDVTGDLSVSGSISGAGKVLQVQQGTFTGRATTTSTGFVATGITVTITPSSTSSKILVNSLCHLAWDNLATKAAITLYRTIGGSSAEIFLGDADGNRRRTTSNLYLAEDTRNGWPITTVYLDSPATTSAVTYQILFARMDGAGTVGINRGIDSYTNASNWGTSASSIVVMEIGA